MTLSRALTIRAAFNKIKKKLADEGCDISEIKSFADIPAVLASVVPEDLAEQAAEILSNEEALTALLTAFSHSAAIGALHGIFTAPSDRVKESDLNA